MAVVSSSLKAVQNSVSVFSNQTLYIKIILVYLEKTYDCLTTSLAGFCLVFIEILRVLITVVVIFEV